MPFERIIAPIKPAAAPRGIAMVRIAITMTKGGKKTEPKPKAMLLLADSILKKHFDDHKVEYGIAMEGTGEHAGYMRVERAKVDDPGASKISKFGHGGARLYVPNVFASMPTFKFGSLVCTELQEDADGFTFKLPIEEWSKVSKPASPAEIANGGTVKSSNGALLNLAGNAILGAVQVKPIQYLKKKGFTLVRKATDHWQLSNDFAADHEPMRALTTDQVVMEINKHRSKQGLGSITKIQLVDEARL